GINGITGQLFASWDRTVADNILLGFEVSGELSGASSEEKRSMVGFGFHTLKIRYQNAVDVAFKIGYKASETVSLYLKTGLSFSQWEMESSGNGITTKNKKKNLWGFRPAIGIQVGLSESVSASLEYSHGFYKKMTFNHEAAAGGRPLPAESKITPRIGAVMARLSYKF
ncbi:MAG: outer membrane beta-barrel protein, partial [bacterium]|nr:outer membrane beta-barrel protein [bacterium]